MKLKRFNPNTVHSVRLGKSTIRFHKGGNISLSPTLVNALGLKQGDKIEIVCDEDSRDKRDWYLRKSNDGFSLRSWKHTNMLWFCNASLGRMMAKQFAAGRVSAGFLVATIPTEVEGVNYYAILTGSAH